MPLIEIAAVRLHPSVSSNKLDGFDSTWTHACNLATKAANGIPFQLYHAVPPADENLYFLIGGWRTGEDHIKFLTTSDAVALAKNIGQYMTVDVVRHIDGDIGALNPAHGDEDRPKKLRVAVYKIPESKVADWDSKWTGERRISGSGGWDLSADVQKQHKAFRQMGEATNSIAAFGGKGIVGSRTWVWVQSAEQSADTLADLENVETEVFEMEHILG